jgi:SAM-dependent methyltransferase
MDAAAARARERGLDVRTGLLSGAGLEPHGFGVVSALHVLEHLPDSSAFLHELAGNAKPGGHVVIEVPNLDSELRRRTLGGWMHLRPLEHLVQFTPATLRHALGSSGLEVVSMTTPSWLLPEHTLDEALGALGRPTWSRFLAPVSPTREVAGARAKVPGPPARAVLRATDRLYERRLRGMVVLAIARVPS